MRSLVNGSGSLDKVHSTPPPPPSLIGDVFYLKMEDSEVALSKVSSKSLYVAFKSRKQVPPTVQKTFQEKFPQLQTDWREIYSLPSNSLQLQTDWREIYSLPFTVTIETKIREFQYKLLNNIVFTNEKFFRLKMIDSPLCTFCKRQIESIEHLFFYCNMTMIFWEALCSWLSNYKIGVQPFTLIDILFGVFNIGDDFSIINHLILTAKLYIYKCKLNNIHPDLRVYKAKIKTVYLVEKKITRRRNKLIKHFKKWEKHLAYVDS